jgi:hypothetical protein
MAVVTDATEEWSAGTVLAENEVWQAQTGWFRVSVEAAPGLDDGIILRGDRGDAIEISSGKTVKYKVIGGQRPARMVRETV